jgi:ECF transporter S component (folate family)
MKTRQMTIDAMMAAMCAVLGYISLDLGSFKITFESLPILVAAMLFGPADGMLVGGIGTLVYQFLRYGVSVTTLLWILPYVVCGLIAGAWSQKHGFRMDRLQAVVMVVVAELAVTGLNTLALYVDSKVYGWYYSGLIMGALGFRLVVCVVKSIAFGVVLPTLTEAVGRVAHRAAA